MLLLKALIAPGAFLAVVTKEGECCYLLEQRACEKKAVLDTFLVMSSFSRELMPSLMFALLLRLTKKSRAFCRLIFLALFFSHNLVLKAGIVLGWSLQD